MEANVIPLNIDFKNKTGEVALVPPEFFANKINNGESFKWVKVNHGIFDIIGRIPNVNKLSSRQIATQMYPLRHFNNRLVPRDTYIDIMDKFIYNVRNYDNISPNYFIGLSDSNGLVAPPDQRRHNAIMGIMNHNNNRTLLHGGLIRRYVVSNQINKILDPIKQNGYKIFVIGPNHCVNYSRFLGDFTHIKIPKSNALANLDDIVNTAKKSLSGKDIFFTSLTTGTFLFIDKFKEENVTVIDIGRAFDYLIKDNKSVHDQPWIMPIHSSQTQRIQRRLNFYNNFVNRGYDHDLKEQSIRKTNNY